LTETASHQLHKSKSTQLLLPRQLEESEPFRLCAIFAWAASAPPRQLRQSFLAQKDDMALHEPDLPSFAFELALLLAQSVEAGTT